MKTNILLIGFGNMGEALYQGLVQTVNPDNIFVCEKNIEKMKKINKKNKSPDINKFIEDCNIIIFAVKPQSFEDTILKIKASLQNKLVISIMAGVSIEKIRKLTSTKRIIRAMPNLGIKEKKGITGWLSTKEVLKQEKLLIKNLFDNLGGEIELKTEDKIDKITALSGSGPAYFFLLGEILKEKALDYGFKENEAEKIAKKTLISAASLVENDQRSLKEWREAVTSKGGTTEQAILHLDKNNFSDVFKTAINQAKKRAEELNK